MIEVKDIKALKFTDSTYLMKAEAENNRKWIITGKDGERIELYKDELFSVMKSDYIPDEVRNIVYCHHSLCDPDRRVKSGDDYYYLIDGVVGMLTYDLSNFYLKLLDEKAKLDCDRYFMIDRWVMVEPIDEEIKTTLILPKGNIRKSDKRYKVLCKNKYIDVEVGDTVMIDKKYLKKLSIDDKIKYVTLNRYVLAKV